MKSRLLFLSMGAGFGIFIVIALYLSRPARDDGYPTEINGTRSAMDIAAAFDCHPAETRHVLVGGNEDDFLPTDDEITTLSDRMSTALFLSRTRHSRYDQDRPNYMFADHFTTPRPSTGLFVIRMRAIVNNDNDGIFIGELPEMTVSDDDAQRPYFSSILPHLETQPGWRREGDVYFARFEDIRFQEAMTDRYFTMRYVPSPGLIENLNDYLRAVEAPRIVDVIVDDDTSVDVIVLVVCEEPSGRSGTTVSLAPVDTGSEGEVLLINCDEPACNPVHGDTICSEALPLLCFQDTDAPSPAWAAGEQSAWSGGAVALTPPIAASHFAKADDADRYCAALHGDGWRAASLHEGAGVGRFFALGHVARARERAWAHVIGQPYGVCWTPARLDAARPG